MADLDPLSERHTSTPEKMDASITYIQKHNETNLAILQAQQKVERETEIRWQDVMRAQKKAEREERIRFQGVMGAQGDAERKEEVRWPDAMTAMELQFHRTNEAMNLRHKNELKAQIEYEQQKAWQGFALLGAGLVGGFLLRGFRLRGFRHRGFRHR